MVASGPTGPRRRLGAELRRLRTGKGLHLDAVAGRLQCSTSKISRLETGKGVPKPADVRALMQLYDVTGDAERDMLMRLVRESRTEGWWESYTDGVAPDPFSLDVGARYTALETEASGIRAFDLAALHGLLQTEAYAKAVLSAQLPHHSAQEIAQLVELRMRRQDRLRSADPLRLTSSCRRVGAVSPGRKPGGDGGTDASPPGVDGPVARRRPGAAVRRRNSAGSRRPLRATGDSG